MARKPEQIINDQVRTWDHRRKLADRGEAPPRPWPVITLSRPFGASAASLAEALSRRTGFAVWDKELVQAIATQSGGDERILRTLDEHRRKAVDDVVHAALQHGTNLQYLRSLLRVVHTLAVHGSGILVGRGANFICKPGEALRLRIVAPLDLRVRWYAAQHRLDEKQARRVVEQADAERADFVRHHFKADPADPTHYDLVLNAGTFALDPLVDLVLHAYEVKFGKRPSLVPRRIEATGAA
jgi:cytidylate kinase